MGFSLSRVTSDANSVGTFCFMVKGCPRTTTRPWMASAQSRFLASRHFIPAFPDSRRPSSMGHW